MIIGTVVHYVVNSYHLVEYGSLMYFFLNILFLKLFFHYKLLNVWFHRKEKKMFNDDLALKIFFYKIIIVVTSGLKMLEVTS